MTIRVDKYLCDNHDITRSVAKKAISKGQVQINQQTITDPAYKVNPNDSVTLRGKAIIAIGPRYIMLNKPTNYICSTKDEHYPSVLKLLDITKTDTLHIAGRLDADTTGLVLITDDGQWSHAITSPKRHCQKTYLATLAEPIDPSAIEQFKQGIQLKGEKALTRSATLHIITPQQVKLTISEGKYHQVKRMFAAIGNKVTALHRHAIGNITLDDNLKLGQWRYLTPSQIDSIR